MGEGRCFNFCLNLVGKTPSGICLGRVSLCGFDSLCFLGGCVAWSEASSSPYILVNLSRGLIFWSGIHGHKSL